MKRILFVDDEPNILSGLKRQLRAQRKEWEMAFADSGKAALEMLEATPFDVVVSDMRMPGMDGAELLGRVKARYPETVRIILSGHSELELVMKSVGPTHQYLTKPCDPDLLRATLKRAFALRDLLADDQLQALAAGMTTLPSLPTLYQRIVAVLQEPDASLAAVGEVIGQEPAMAAKVLQLVNSAFFGLRREVADAREAVSFLGLETITALVLSVHVFAELKEATGGHFPIEALWSHSLAVGTMAKQIALAETGEKQTGEEALMAGLLHDVGKLILRVNMPEQYDEVERAVAGGGCDLLTAETRVFGTTHAEVGAYLLGLWGLPDGIVEAVAFHHRPTACASNGFAPLAAVHVVNCLEKAIPTDHPARYTGEVDEAYLEQAGLADRLEAWQELIEAKSTAAEAEAATP